MTSTKRAIRQGVSVRQIHVRQIHVRLGPITVVALMMLWGVAMIAPAALPH